ncbi:MULTISPECIES: OmpA family protein [unclassified Arcicella]|uniref:OmpA family protein n=1 Tax=unclassified Arcicella TaxID=2644986 RepID=UPI0028659C6F|nr:MULTISPECIES: OmpA family protein [unclassified Arcicella]MDR6562978.1 outer membrane protein OmpA-like peptidoglycan-associated protein [Arcicella sp. BE51]MDR6813062.1 outer membrane protein OmpA-like peptidoglycan-associated protein [Arcicella sp. BE140]MDR6824376.1 outer membrane protein OmpA-like peptidoglycan-associated protein [Arcicella sp. BE139]
MRTINMYTRSISKIVLLLLVLAPSFYSCNSFKKLNNAQRGAIIGAGTGAAMGAAIGRKSNPAVYAIVGSAVGGIAGTFVGKYMDKQAEKLKKDLDVVADVERVGEGIKITMKSGVLFDFNSSKINPTVNDNLIKFAETLKQYPDTEILVAGHTDNVGTEAYNMKLSQQRADAVAAVLKANNVSRSRLTVLGYGEKDPVADNTLESGREQNRRVEFAIVADDKLKKDAVKASGNEVSKK